MKQYYITFRSVTYGQRGERVLKQAGMDCLLRRTPRWMESKGCGYAVQVENPIRAAEILKDAGAAFEKIYEVRGEDRRELILP